MSTILHGKSVGIIWMTPMSCSISSSDQLGVLVTFSWRTALKSGACREEDQQDVSVLLDSLIRQHCPRTLQSNDLVKQSGPHPFFPTLRKSWWTVSGSPFSFGFTYGPTPSQNGAAEVQM